MSSSAANSGVLKRRAKRGVGSHHHFRDGLDDAEFKRRVDRGWREAFLVRGIDPETMRTSASFDGSFGGKRTKK